MIEKYGIRTDLALEDKERFESDNVEVKKIPKDLLEKCNFDYKNEEVAE